VDNKRKRREKLEKTSVSCYRNMLRELISLKIKQSKIQNDIWPCFFIPKHQ